MVWTDFGEQVRRPSIRVPRTKAGPLEFDPDIFSYYVGHRSGNLVDAWHFIGVVVESEGRIGSLSALDAKITFCRSYPGTPTLMFKYRNPRCTTSRRTTI
jgi:hypothetical protein